MVKWDTITDDAPGPNWNSGIFQGTYGDGTAVSGGVYVFNAGGGYSGIATIGYDLIGSEVIFLMTRSTGGYSGATLKADASNTDILGFYYYSSGPKLTGYQMGGNWSGSTTSADINSFTDTDVWGRFREDSGTVYIDYSLDGTNWTNIHSAAATSSMLTALADSKLQIEQGPFGSSLSVFATFDKINLPPAPAADELAMIGVAVNVGAAGTTAPGTHDVAMTGVAVDVAPSASWALSLSVALTGVAVDVSIPTSSGADTAPTTLSIAMTGVVVEVTPAATTSQAAGDALALTGVVVDVVPSASWALALAVPLTGVAVEVAPAGTTGPAGAAVALTGVAVEVTPAGSTSPTTLSVALTGVLVEAIPSAAWNLGTKTIALSGVVIEVAVSKLGLTLGNLVVTLVSGEMTVGYEAGAPHSSYDVGKPYAALSAGAPYLEP